MRKIIISLSFIFLLPSISFADVYINEVFYSPTSKQWIEIYNDTSGEIDLTKFKILDAGAAVNGHSISTTTGTSNMVPSHAYAVVSKTPDDFVGSSFPVFKSSLGIKTTGDTVTLRDTTGAVSDNAVTVASGSATDGNSLQKNSSVWIAALPTPGLTNATEATPPPDNTSNASTTTSQSSTGNGSSGSSSSTTSAHSSQAPLSDSEPKMNMEISAGRDRLTTVGNTLHFKASVTKVSGVDSRNVVYHWTFGDGSQSQGGETTHAYFFPDNIRLC